MNKYTLILFFLIANSLVFSQDIKNNKNFSDLKFVKITGQHSEIITYPHYTIWPEKKSYKIEMTFNDLYKPQYSVPFAKEEIPSGLDIKKDTLLRLELGDHYYSIKELYSIKDKEYVVYK